MNFSERQRDPRRHLTGIAVVILFHALVVYALLTGLAKKVVDVVRAPIETKVIEEVKKPPPPPDIVVPPPPRLEAPPPPFIPPPEVQIATPPPPAPTITATTPTPPPAPVVIAPAPPPVVAAPAPPPPAGPSDARVICTRIVQPAVPAVRDFTGLITIVVRFTVADGKVTKAEAVDQRFGRLSDRRLQRAFVAAAEAATYQFVCPGNHVATVPFEFTIN